LYFLGGIGFHACVPMAAADAASATTTGKAATDHALDAVTGKDCRVVEGALRADRRVCEDTGSPATARDFKGPMRE
jgi:propanediol dehydratase small subunit